MTAKKDRQKQKPVKSHHRDYFEAIIQLRNPSKELIDFVLKQVEKREDVFISKIIKYKYGYDYYISSQRFARALGRKMSKNFKGELKSTRKIYTMDRQTSKDVYRVTVLFRQP